jgi:hypothetical protein
MLTKRKVKRALHNLQAHKKEVERGCNKHVPLKYFLENTGVEGPYVFAKVLKRDAYH